MYGVIWSDLCVVEDFANKCTFQNIAQMSPSATSSGGRRPLAIPPKQTEPYYNPIDDIAEIKVELDTQPPALQQNAPVFPTKPDGKL